MQTETQKLGANLKRIRLEKGISQGDIAGTLNVSRGFVSNIENGKTNPTLATIAKLARAVGVSVNELLRRPLRAQHAFTETPLATRYGTFMMRVYADTPGKETVALYTSTLDVAKPVLTRVHSECLTGDTFGSFQCDCGEQLQRALGAIAADGNGILIYLRQEGRGIGLFEKIKSYELQRKGYDTHEANLLLGHQPDERTYEKAKMVCDDLGITRIKLITNNPSKVSDIAKLGIDVAERVPLVVPANQHNAPYFAAKRDKFKHFFNEEVSYYFYQFHAEHVRHIEEIGEFLKTKTRDPLLKICVGINSSHGDLKNPRRISDIEHMFRACELYAGFVPVLHFSFRDSRNPLKDLRAIQQKMPFVKYLQTNDVPDSSLSIISAACEQFLADIPLSDANFDLVHNPEFRDTITRNKAFILLDNSQGRGVRETRDSLKKKIDTLLGYGLNDIAIFGGFGPD
jgi:GTP cyclohydrolase II